MSVAGVTSFLLTALALSTTVFAEDPPPVVQFSAGEIFDINNLIQDVGLTPFEPFADAKTKFTLLNSHSKRFFRVEGDVKAENSIVTGTVGGGAGATPFWFKRNPGGGFVTIAPDVASGIGNGAGVGGSLFTTINAEWLKETTHQYAIRRVDPNATSGPGVLLQNRGNALCVSLGGKNRDPLIVQPCSATDDKQRWQLCQPTDSGNLCWPQQDDALQGRRKAKRHAPAPAEAEAEAPAK